MTKKQWKKKVLAMAMMISMIFALVGCGGKGEKKEVSLNVPEGTPIYEDDEYIELAAYMGPRRGGYRYWNGEYGTHPDDPEGGWDSFINEQSFKDYMDAGFTYVLSEGDAFYDYDYDLGQSVTKFEDSDLYDYMELAEKVGLKVVPTSNFLVNLASSSDYRLTDEHKQTIDKMIEDLSKYKMFKGLTLRDEPDASCAKTFGAIQSYVWEKHPDFFFYTCMLPIYGKMSSFSNGITDDKEAAYTEYVQAIADNTGTFAYDHYPLYVDPIQNVTMVQADYYQNFELVAQNAKKNDYDAGFVVQTTGWGTKDGEMTARHPRVTETKADISFQVYSALAYGMKYINYYTYWEHYAQSDATYIYSAMVDYPEKNGQEPIKTKTYYAVKEMNEELKKFDHVFLKYDWEGTMAVTAKNRAKSTLLACVDDYSSPRIKSAESKEEAIIGCLKDEKGYDGFMIVNATDPGQNVNNAVTIEFAEATSAICYINGEEQTIELKDGTYTFELTAGQGIFVIPVK